MNEVGLSIDIDKIRKNTKWFLIIGILLIIMGFTGISCSFLYEKVFITILGFLLMLAGIGQIVQTVFSPNILSGIIQLFLGIFYVAAGISFVRDPVDAAEVLTLFISCFMFASGLCKILMSLNHRYSKDWGMGLFSGILSLILGAMLILNWPISGLWFIGFIISLEMIFTGWIYIAFVSGTRYLYQESTV